MKLAIHQVDAFARHRFGGNPAAVIVLDDWLDTELLQAIALENNLSETAYAVPRGDHFDLRWFTPTVEVDLCGHATLATAHVLLANGYVSGSQIVFHTRSGELRVERSGELLAMDFPSRRAAPRETMPELERALGAVPRELLDARSLLAVFDAESDVAKLQPDLQAVARLGGFAVIATAPGDDCDFVSRFFAPAQGVPEDPATGSAHCTLVPYWSERLGRRELHALQISQRVGEFFCVDRGERVQIAGRVVEYLRGEIEV